MRLLIALTAAASVVLSAARAQACGGFFCSNQPIDQAGEQIAFAVSEGRVQAHVQIQYQGDARKFAWVVPVHGLPTLSVGSAAMFTFLSGATRPVFLLDWSGGGACGDVYPPMLADGATAGGGPENGGVTVVSQAAVGPYETAILSASDAGAMTTWLRANQYDLTDAGAAALAPYVAEGGYHFVALRLQQDKGVGDLRPIVLDFAGDTPCIPIRLTAIAAAPNMPITAYVFAASRAVPTNYRHVLVNEARIDWFSFASNYPAVATAAVDEAGGRAFLTEAAGPVATILGAAKLDDGRIDMAALRAITDPVAYVVELRRQGFPRDGLLELLERYVPLPAALAAQGVTPQQFYNAIEQYADAIANDPGRAAFDAAGLSRELDESIVQPLRRAQAMIDTHPYLTRLFTTMSAAEMTVDPEFAFNSSLPDVPREHRARLVCDAATQRSQLVLADGRTFDLPQNPWNAGPLAADQAGPAAARVEQLASMGGPSVVKDNLAPPPANDVTGGCGGCAAPGASLLAAAGLAMRRRRRA